MQTLSLHCSLSDQIFTLGHIPLPEAPSLFLSIKSQIFKSALTSLAITVLFFMLFYLSHVAFLFFTSGPIAFITEISIVLGEAAVASRFITKALWLADAQQKLFDTVRHTTHPLGVRR